MRKAITILVVAVLLISVLSASAFASGGHCGRGGAMSRQPVNYAVCAVDGCDTAGFHQHDSVWYCSQTAYNRYDVCAVEGCETAGLHQHDGVWYCSQIACYNYEICTVDGCTEVGVHEHDGIYYRCAVYNMGRGCARRWN